jgi:membrane-associated phospholipid phosphatase
MTSWNMEQESGWTMVKNDIPPRILWISSIASICVFLAISSVLIVSGTGPLPPDRYVYRHFSIADDDAVDLIVLVTDIGNPIAMAILTVLFGTYLLLRKDRRNATVLMGGMLLVFFLDLSLKLAFQRERPGAGGIPLDSYSYPSGHTFATAFIFLFAANYSLERIGKRWVRWSILALCLIFPVIIGATRLLLGVHWVTDVLGGYAMGIFLVSTLLLLSNGPIYIRSVMRAG